MSYVRSSKDSDVYVYGARDKIFLHIAYNRGSAGVVPMPKTGASAEEWDAFMNDVIPLGHPEAGKTYTFTRYSECIAKLEELRDSGLLVPEHPLERLRKEMEENNDEYRV